MLAVFVPQTSKILTFSDDPNYMKFWAFWQSVDAILEDVSVAETIKTSIFQCYGSPTCVTRLKMQ